MYYTVTYKIANAAEGVTTADTKIEAVEFFAKRVLEARKIGGTVAIEFGTVELLKVAY